MPHNKNDLWLEDDAEQASPAVYSAPTMYSADYLRETQPGAPPIVRVGFGPGGEPSFIFRNDAGEIKYAVATRENSANERPRGFVSALARLMYGGNR